MIKAIIPALQMMLIEDCGEHNGGEDKLSYTYSRRPIQLKYDERFQDIKQAIAWEKQLKGWSRKKKEALFRDDWEEIKRLANTKARFNQTTRLRQAQTDSYIFVL